MIFEVTGEHQAGKTTLATWCSKQVGCAAWVVAPQESPEALWEALDYQPAAALTPRNVAEAFEMVELLSTSVDLVVLDSLSGLSPDHPEGTQIAGDVTKALRSLRLSAPLLAVNQDRHPVRPGGQRWMASAHSLHLECLRRRPALYTRLGGSKLWLVWWPFQAPQVKVLENEDRLWVPGKAEGGDRDDGDPGVAWIQRVVGSPPEGGGDQPGVRGVPGGGGDDPAGGIPPELPVLGIAGGGRL